MNVGNMTKLRDHLVWLRDNGKAYKFNMGSWLILDDEKADRINDLEAWTGKSLSPYECGTVACLAGHAVMIGNAPKDAYVEEWATEWLGLTESESDALFYAQWRRKDVEYLRDVSLEDAIAHLNTLLEGEARRAR